MTFSGLMTVLLSKSVAALFLGSKIQKKIIKKNSQDSQAEYVTNIVLISHKSFKGNSSFWVEVLIFLVLVHQELIVEKNGMIIFWKHCQIMRTSMKEIVKLLFQIYNFYLSAQCQITLPCILASISGHCY